MTATSPSLQSTSYGYPNNGSCGNSSVFTYYSEFHRSWEGAGLAEAVVIVCVCVASLSTNASVIYCALRHPSLRTTTNYLVVNLAVADAVFALTAPLVAAVRLGHDWTFSGRMCKMLPLAQMLCGAVLLWSLTVISIERYRCIVSHPLKPHFTVRGVLVVVAALWLVPLALCAPLASYFEVVLVTVGGEAGHAVCTLCYPQEGRLRLAGVFLAFLLIGLAVLPASIMIFNYYYIFKKLKSSNNFSVSVRKRSKFKSHGREGVAIANDYGEEEEEEEEEKKSKKEKMKEEEDKEEENNFCVSVEMRSSSKTNGREDIAVTNDDGEGEEEEEEESKDEKMKEKKEEEEENNFSVSVKMRSSLRSHGRYSIVVVDDDKEEEKEKQAEEEEEEEKSKQEEKDDSGDSSLVAKIVCRKCSQFLLDNGGSSLNITSEMKQRCSYEQKTSPGAAQEESATVIDGQSAAKDKRHTDKRISGRIVALMKHAHNSRVVSILIVDVLAVFLMWAPIWAILIAIYVDSAEGGAKTIKSHDFIYCLTVAYANSWLNAILYGVLNGNFRPYICHK